MRKEKSKVRMAWRVLIVLTKYVRRCGEKRWLLYFVYFRRLELNHAISFLRVFYYDKGIYRNLCLMAHFASHIQKGVCFQRLL